MGVRLPPLRAGTRWPPRRTSGIGKQDAAFVEADDAGADAEHVVQTLHRLVGAVGLPMGDDGGALHRTDSEKAVGDGTRFGGVHVDGIALVVGERAGGRAECHGGGKDDVAESTHSIDSLVKLKGRD